jgi:hypothetical protein
LDGQNRPRAARIAGKHAEQACAGSGETIQGIRTALARLDRFGFGLQ